MDELYRETALKNGCNCENRKVHNVITTNMEDLKKVDKDLMLMPLSYTEQGLLKGGFVTIPNGDYSLASISNRNCSTSGWFNGNCGCPRCSRDSSGPPPRPGTDGSGTPPPQGPPR